MDLTLKAYKQVKTEHSEKSVVKYEILEEPRRQQTM